MAAGLTQEGLAERAQLSAHAISTLERGVRQTPHRETVQRLAEALRLSTRDCTVFEGAAQRLDARSVPSRRASALPQVESSPGPDDPPATLIGRAGEQTLLDHHLGVGIHPLKLAPVLLLADEPGIGKSHLLHDASRRARCSGWRVLQGGCQRRGDQEPYAPLLEALERHLQHQAPTDRRAALHGCAWLVRLLPELVELVSEPVALWTLPPEQERRLMFAAVGRLLSNTAGPAGTLLVLDDLQWAGADAHQKLQKHGAAYTLYLASEWPLAVSAVSTRGRVLQAPECGPRQGPSGTWQRL